jgi:hypothetical protein
MDIFTGPRGSAAAFRQLPLQATPEAVVSTIKR